MTSATYRRAIQAELRAASVEPAHDRVRPIHTEPDPCSECGASVAPFLVADEPGWRPKTRTAYCWGCWQRMAT